MLLMCPTEPAPRPDRCVLLELNVLQQALCPTQAQFQTRLRLCQLGNWIAQSLKPPYSCFSSVDSLSYWDTESSELLCVPLVHWPLCCGSRASPSTELQDDFEITGRYINHEDTGEIQFVLDCKYILHGL